MSAKIHVGTSGWHYRHWLGNFYPDDLPVSRMLEHYVRHFDTVELNNSFYRLPAEDTFQAWRNDTPPHFLFSVKASRYITHMKKLGDPEESIQLFTSRAEKLGRKLGPILFQLPPRWKSNPEKLSEFVNRLPKKHRYTFELRETSWMNDAVYSILRKANAAFCIYEIDYYQSPLALTADWTYIRLHGPGAKYQGLYGRRGLQPWVRRIEAWSRELRDVFIYFDNDQAGYAARDALELKLMLGLKT
jgi:uncharacterized protein YecE (DUF72 family)